MSTSHPANIDLAAALANPDDTVFFDAATTQMRADLVTRAIEAGRLDLHQDQVRIHQLLDQIVHMFQIQASAKGIQFEYRLETWLPSRTTSASTHSAPALRMSSAME